MSILGNRLHIKEQGDLEKYTLSEGEPITLKQLLGFVEDHLCLELELGIDSVAGFSSCLELEALAIDSKRIYFIARDSEFVLSLNNLKLKNFTPERLIHFGSDLKFPDLIKMLETLDLNLIVDVGVLDSNKNKITKASSTTVGLAILHSLQETWVIPNSLSIWGLFSSSGKHKYSLSFSKAKTLLLKGHKVAMKANEDQEEVIYYLDGEFIYEEFREVVSLARLSKTILNANFRLLD